MTTFPGSPRLLKGALVTLALPNPLPSVIPFQYNPETLSRSLEIQAGSGEGDRSEVLRLKGAPVETIKLDVELDATDQLEHADPTAVSMGVHPQLAALELLVYPQTGVVIANTHLTANKDGDWSSGNRYHTYQGAQLTVLHRVLARAGATIVTGDFNIASDSPLYPRIIDGGAWRDPFVEADPVTYHGEFLPPGYPPHRIDYVLVSGFPVLDTEVLFADPVTLPDGRTTFLSDHVALTARIDLSAPRRPAG